LRGLIDPRGNQYRSRRRSRVGRVIYPAGRYAPGSFGDFRFTRGATETRFPVPSVASYGRSFPPPPLPSPVPPPFHCPAHSGVYAASVQDEESGGAPPFPGAIHYAELQAVRSGSHCNRRINNPRQRLDRRDKRGRRGRRQPPRGSVLRIPRRPFPKETRALD